MFSVESCRKREVFDRAIRVPPCRSYTPGFGWRQMTARCLFFHYEGDARIFAVQPNVVVGTHHSHPLALIIPGPSANLFLFCCVATAGCPFPPRAHPLSLQTPSHLHAHKHFANEGRAVPLAPLFSPAAAEAAAAAAPASAPTSTTAAVDHDRDNAVPDAREGVCARGDGAPPPAAATPQQETPLPAAVVREFQQALEACRVGTAGAAPAEGKGAATRTLNLLDSLLKEGMLDGVRSMFAVGGVDGDDSSATEEQEWSRCVAVEACGGGVADC